MNWQFWKKKKKIVPFGGARGISPKIEDVSQTRNIQEKLASISPGSGFMIATREGFKVFKCIEIRKYEEKKN